MTNTRLMLAACWILISGQSASIAQSLQSNPAAGVFDPIAVLRIQSEPLGDSHSGMFLGSMSCSSASCHGSPRRESALKSAADYFLKRDRHQLAGTVLYDDRSQEIAKRLNLTHPWKAQECLACHAPAAVHVVDREEFDVKLADGVGCESCHGPSRQWLSTHHTTQWKQPEIWSGLNKRQAGFHETKELLTRVNLCADCHVGNAEQSVTHDLIAAGHPRLTFEYASYQSQMPIHWQRSADRRRSPVANSEPSADHSTYEATNWLIGQLVNAEHELDILSAAAVNPDVAWPELGQYDCIACHHSLSSSVWRQSRIAWKLGPGELPWGTWGLGFVKQLQTHLPDIVSEQFPEGQNVLGEAVRSMSAGKTETLASITELRKELAKTTKHLSTASLSSEDISRLRQALLNDHEKLTTQGWDRSAQLYLAAVALDMGFSDARGEGNQIEPSRQDSYLRLRQLLLLHKKEATSPNRNRQTPDEQNDRQAIRAEFRRIQSQDRPNDDDAGRTPVSEIER